MIVSDRQFGAELVTQKGKIFIFDSIECMASFVVEGTVESSQIHSRWVTPFDDPENLIDADSAFYLHSQTLRSPMGMNLSAYASEAAAQDMQTKFAGDILRWKQVHALIQSTTGNKHPIMSGF
jgi:copper chaperone NosL